MCFIDLQKAYDSVDRELLWEVLACFGVPANMPEVIRQFRHGMGARVGMDGGEHSDWVDATKGLRQGCVRSPFPCNTFFTAALHVVHVCLSEDADIVQNLVHLDDDGAGRVKEPLA